MDLASFEVARPIARTLASLRELARVRHEDAVALIRSSVEGREGAWADFGCGKGTFTRALHEVRGSNSHIYAVDADAGAVTEVKTWAAAEAPNVAAMKGDFTQGPGRTRRVRQGKFTVAESRPSNYSGVIYAAHAELGDR